MFEQVVKKLIKLTRDKMITWESVSLDEVLTFLDKRMMLHVHEVYKAEYERGSFYFFFLGIVHILAVKTDEENIKRIMNPLNMDNQEALELLYQQIKPPKPDKTLEFLEHFLQD